MNIKKRFLKIKNQRGGALILTMMAISVIIFLFISMASFSLSQTMAHVARSNAKVQQISVGQDLAQAVARAYTLGKAGNAAPCPSGTVPHIVPHPSGAVRFCFPMIANFGLTSSGMYATCVDLDQNGSTTYDQYCIEQITSVAKWTEPQEENPSYIAKFIEKVSRKFTNLIVDVESSFAACTWHQCDDPTYADPLQETTEPAISSVQVVPAAPFITEPTGSAVAATGGSLVPNHSLETWFPSPSWSNSNEMFTPSCFPPASGGQDDYWLGCIKCSNPAFQCFEFRICPMSSSPCTLGTYLTQGVAFY